MLHTALLPEIFLGLAFPSKGLASVCGLCTAGVCFPLPRQYREYTFKTETNQGLTVFLGHRYWQFLSSRPKPSCTLLQCGNITHHLPSRDMEVTLRLDWTHPPVSSICHFVYVLRTSSEIFASFVIAVQIHTRPMVGTVPYGIFQLGSTAVQHAGRWFIIFGTFRKWMSGRASKPFRGVFLSGEFFGVQIGIPCQDFRRFRAGAIYWLLGLWRFSVATFSDIWRLCDKPNFQEASAQESFFLKCFETRNQKGYGEIKLVSTATQDVQQKLIFDNTLETNTFSPTNTIATITRLAGCQYNVGFHPFPDLRRTVHDTPTDESSESKRPAELFIIDSSESGR